MRARTLSSPRALLPFSARSRPLVLRRGVHGCIPRSQHRSPHYWWRVVPLLHAVLPCSCVRVPARPATRAELGLVHTQHFIEQILDRELDIASARDLRQYAAQWNSVYLNNSSPEAALLSAGGTVALTEEVHGVKFRALMSLLL